MIRSAISRLLGQRKVSSNPAPNNVIKGIVQRGRTARSIRGDLLRIAKAPGFSVDHFVTILDEMKIMGWPEVEIEKVRAYVDFFSGANARGYERVVNQALVRSDFDLFMTACVHCYLADRFAEGAAQ